MRVRLFQLRLIAGFLLCLWALALVAILFLYHPGGPVDGLVAATLLGPMLFQSAEMGALPTLRAATDPAVTGAQYYGPAGFLEQRGHPVLVRSSAQSHDEDLQRRLWTVSEELTGVRFGV